MYKTSIGIWEGKEIELVSKISVNTIADSEPDLRIWSLETKVENLWEKS